MPSGITTATVPSTKPPTSWDWQSQLRDEWLWHALLRLQQRWFGGPVRPQRTSFEPINKVLLKPPMPNRLLFENTAKDSGEVAAEHGAALKRSLSRPRSGHRDIDNDGDSDLLLLNAGETATSAAQRPG